MRTWMTWFTSLWARQKRIERLSASKESTFQTEEIGTEKAHLFTVQIFPAVQGSREGSVLSPLRQLPLQGSGCNSGQQISPLELIIACNSCVWVGNKCTRKWITSNGWKINLRQISYFGFFFSFINYITWTQVPTFLVSNWQQFGALPQSRSCTLRSICTLKQVGGLTVAWIVCE